MEKKFVPFQFDSKEFQKKGIEKLFLLMMIVFSGYGSYLIFRSYETENWNIKQAKVIKSEFLISEKDSTSALYEIEYSYSINDKLYKSNVLKIGFQGQSTLTHIVKDYYKRFFVGKEISVFVNPNDPEDSVVLKGEYGYGTLFFIMGICIYFFAKIYIYIKSTFYNWIYSLYK